MTEASEGPVRRRRTLAFASATHVWSDLFFALMIPLLPLMREDPALDLSYTEVGLLRTGFGTASIVLQVPAGFLAERWNEFWLLVVGNIWVGAGFLLMAGLTSFVPLLAATVLGGLGGGTQHPLATSMVSRAYRDEGHSAAVGTVNFAGDIGKLLAPLVVVIGLGWRSTMRLVGAAGIVFMALSMLMRRSVSSPRTDAGRGGSPSLFRATAPTRGLITLGSIGFMDAATRTAALTFVPFVLADRGAGTREVLILLTLLLAGGAAGQVRLRLAGRPVRLDGPGLVDEGRHGAAAARDTGHAGRVGAGAGARARVRAEWHVVRTVRRGRPVRRRATGGPPRTATTTR